MLSRFEGPLGGVVITLVTAFCFYSLVYFIATTAVENHMERKFYTPTCEILIEQGWEIELGECIERFNNV